MMKRLIKRLTDWYKRRYCKHAFVQIDSWYEKDEDITYPVRMYECLKCGIRVKSGKPY